MANKHMSGAEYERLVAAVNAANRAGDREALRRVIRCLVTRYGLADRRAVLILRMMKF